MHMSSQTLSLATIGATQFVKTIPEVLETGKFTGDVDNFQLGVNAVCRYYLSEDQRPPVGNAVAMAIVELYDPWLCAPNSTRRYLGEYDFFMIALDIPNQSKSRLDRDILNRVAQDPAILAEYAAIVIRGARYDVWGSGLLTRQIEFLLHHGVRFRPIDAAALYRHIADSDAFLSRRLARRTLLESPGVRPGDWDTPTAWALLEAWRLRYRADLELAPAIYRLRARLDSWRVAQDLIALTRNGCGAIIRRLLRPGFTAE